MPNKERFEQLEKEFNQSPQAKGKSVTGYLFAFIDFLVDKIVALENPSVDVIIEADDNNDA